MNAALRRAGLAAAAVLASVLTVPAGAASTAPAAAADAYALDVNARITPANVAVDQGPYSRTYQEYPPQAAAVSEDAELETGQIPMGSGALVQNIEILASQAGANSQPLAGAEAVAENVQLLNQGGTPLITARTLRAVSTTDCINAPSAEGTEIADLRVAGTDVPINNPAPNTEVAAAIFNPLGLRVIANEQHQTADGRGLVVNALHIYNYNPPSVPVSLFVGDIIVSHAMSTVNCPNGAPSTGGNNDIFIVKNADKAKAKPGDTVTYTATVQNKSGQSCPVNQVIDHLPIAFTFESTSGGFGTTATVVNRPGGGQDVLIKPTGVTIPAGGSVTQTYVVKVRDDAAFGTYFNNVELLCGNLGNWVKGLDAPVEVTDNEPPPPQPKKQCEDGKDNDGDGKIDFPADPGCASPKDDNEVDEHPRTGGNDLTGFAVLLLLGAYVVRRKLAVS